MKRDLTKIFHAYDVRGTYPKEIDEDAAFRIAIGYCHHTHAKYVLVGHDARASSPKLYEAVIRGIRHAGARAVLSGLCTTPEFTWICARYKYPAGLMITASHLPAEFNGIKLFLANGTPLGMTEGLDRVQALAENATDTPPPHGKAETVEFRTAYIRWLSHYAPSSSRKIIIDASNGTGGIILTPLLKQLPLSAEIIDARPDPKFKGHDPNPLDPHATDRLKRKILQTHADLGFILDGDADRTLTLDEHGNTIHPNHLAAFLISQLPRKSTIIVDSNSSRVIHEIAHARKIRVIVSPVGRTHVLALMKKHKARFGAESSGHTFHKEAYGADNDVLTIFKTLTALEKDPRPLSEIIAGIAKYPLKDIVIKAKLETTLKKLEEYSPHEYLDGYRFNSTHTWGFMRTSNTEQIVRLRIEGNRLEDVEKLAKKLQP